MRWAGCTPVRGSIRGRKRVPCSVRRISGEGFTGCCSISAEYPVSVACIAASWSWSRRPDFPDRVRQPAIEGCPAWRQFRKTSGAPAVVRLVRPTCHTGRRPFGADRRAFPAFGGIAGNGQSFGLPAVGQGFSRGRRSGHDPERFPFFRCGRLPVKSAFRIVGYRKSGGESFSVGRFRVGKYPRGAKI